jgi:putative Mn2+ efflux pump MntP
MLQSLLLAAGLGMDAMSVCMSIGVRWHGPRQRFRLAWHMGLFQFLMPLIGWYAGENLAKTLSGVGRYVAASLLFLLGAKMLLEAIKAHPGASAEDTQQVLMKKSKDPTRGWSLMALSILTSLDALVAGFSLGVSGGATILLTSIIIGIVAASMALAGIALGKAVGVVLGKPAEILGAIVLIALAVSFLFVNG